MLKQLTIFLHYCYKTFLPYNKLTAWRKIKIYKMGLNFVVPINLVLEVILVALQSYILTFHQDTIELILIGVISTYFLFSIVWLFYFKKSSRKFHVEIRIFRGLQGLLLVALSAVLYYASKPVTDPADCLKIESELSIPCHKYVPKLITASIALVDALVYFINPCRKVVENDQVRLTDRPTRFRRNNGNNQTLDPKRYTIFGYNVGRSRSRSVSESLEESVQNPRAFNHHQPRQSVNYPPGPGNHRFSVYMPFGTQSHQSHQSPPPVPPRQLTRHSFPSTSSAAPQVQIPRMAPAPPTRQSYTGDGLGLELRHPSGCYCDKCRPRERF